MTAALAIFPDESRPLSLEAAAPYHREDEGLGRSAAMDKISVVKSPLSVRIYPDLCGSGFHFFQSGLEGILPP